MNVKVPVKNCVQHQQMPTALSNGHSHSKSKQYLERQPVSCLGPTRSWFQIQWPFLYHPVEVLLYLIVHAILYPVFSLVSMTSLSSLLSFCWSSKCWDAPDLRTRPLSHLVHIFLLFFNQKQKNNHHPLLHQPNCFLCTYESPFYIILFIHTDTRKYFYLCVSIISFSLLEHKLHENNKFGDLLIYASEQTLTYRRC